MKIDETKCTGCGICVPYCPVGAIALVDGKGEKTAGKKKKKLAVVDLDECAECGVCLRSANCPVDAVYQQEMEYPRTVRSLMSDVLTIAPESQISGRGTEEMKTNEVTGRFPAAWPEWPSRWDAPSPEPVCATWKRSPWPLRR